jgi:hypothetical protein
VSFEARFWSRVVKTESCWLWTGALSGGYGHCRITLDGASRARGAHRVAYELLVGPVPDGFELDHLCRVKHCVNPAHLEPVTHRENMLRGEVPAARQAKQTKCSYGHPIANPADYYLDKTGRKRQCKRCAKAYSLEQNRARRDGRKPRPVRELALAGLL